MIVMTALALLSAAAPATAKNGFYLGGSVGQTTLEIGSYELDLEDFDFSADTTSYKILAGYRFFAYLGVEASYLHFGTLSDSFDASGEPVTVDTELKGFDACAMGMLPIGIVDLYAKLGIVVWDADISALIGGLPEFTTDSGSDLVYGAGIQVRFRGLGVRGEIEYFDIANADSVYLISVGATYTF
jgi:hypothetical protein